MRDIPFFKKEKAKRSKANLGYINKNLLGYVSYTQTRVILRALYHTSTGELIPLTFVAVPRCSIPKRNREQICNNIGPLEGTGKRLKTDGKNNSDSPAHHPQQDNGLGTAKKEQVQQTSLSQNANEIEASVDHGIFLQRLESVREGMLDNYLLETPLSNGHGELFPVSLSLSDLDNADSASCAAGSSGSFSSGNGC